MNVFDPFDSEQFSPYLILLQRVGKLDRRMKRHHLIYLPERNWAIELGLIAATRLASGMELPDRSDDRPLNMRGRPVPSLKRESTSSVLHRDPVFRMLVARQGLPGHSCFLIKGKVNLS